MLKPTQILQQVLSAEQLSSGQQRDQIRVKKLSLFPLICQVSHSGNTVCLNPALGAFLFDGIKLLSSVPFL